MADGPRRLLKRPRPKYFTEDLKSDFKRFKQKNTTTDSKPLAKLKDLTEEAIQKLNAGEPELLWKLIYEFTWSKLTWGTTLPMGAWITRTCGSPVPDNVARIIVEVFDAIHGESPSHKEKILTLSRELTAFKNCMTDEHFRSNSSTLDLFLDPQQKSMVKGSRTQMYYKQETFNLFLEDSEGFAKLVTYLGEIASQNLDIPFKRFVNNLEIIIGRFGLNTDRVLDCVLHALELNPTNPLLLQYLRTVPKTSVTQILGFKFRGFVLPETANTPFELYRLAIRLFENDLIDLQLLLPHLSPSMEQTLTKRYEVEKEEREAASNLLKHNLNESEADRTKRQQKESKAVAARKRNRLEETKNHQVFELLNAALQPETFNVELVNTLFDVLETAVPASRKSIRQSLFGILQDLVEPVYKEHFSQNMCLSGFEPKSKSSKAAKSSSGWTMKYYGVTGLDDFPKKILPLMRWLGVYACANPEVCSLVARVLAQCVRLNKLDDPEYAKQIEELACLLCGASGSMGYNVGIANDIWGILSQLPYHRRFAIYGYWRFTIYPKFSEMMYIRNEEIKNTKNFMKRYHVDEEDPRTIGRKISRLVHRNPTVVLDEILTQLESYSKNITMLAEAMRYFNHISQDILVWICICHMEQSRNSGPARPMIERDGVPTLWFNSLSTLIALFFQKTSNGELDVAPVIQYVINKMHAGSSAHLLLFSRIISRISGIESFGEMITDGQLDALGGSRLLQFLAIHGDSKGPGRKTMIRHCIKTMFDQNQILPLFILLSHTKDRLSSGHLDDELESRYPVISDLVDRCNDAFVQLFSYIELSEPFLGKSETLGPILPSFAELVQKYGMSHAFAFHICRAHFGDVRISSHPDAVVDVESEGTDAFKALEKTCEMLLDESTLSSITASFYACFWAYRTRDIQVPTLQYNQHAEKLTKQINVLKKKNDAASKKEMKRLESDLATLRKDEKEQSKTFKTISQKVLSPKQSQWFKGVSNPEATISTILFKCVIPRLCISDLDAKYCSHFVLFLTNEGTPGFEFITFVWQILQSFVPIVRSLTNAETRRFARFFSTLLHGVEQWRVDDGKFRAFTKSPASKVPEDGFLPQIKTKADLCSILRLFRSLLTESIVLCLNDKDPRCQKNCVIFIHHMIDQYPKIQKFHRALAQSIKNLDLLKDSPMDLLVKRVKVILDKKYPSCVSAKDYGGRNLLAKPKAKVPIQKREVEMKDVSKKTEKAKKTETKKAPAKKAPTKKAPAKKAPAKAPAKKAPAKAPAKKAAPKTKQNANPKSKAEMDTLLQQRLKDEQEKKKAEAAKKATKEDSKKRTRASNERSERKAKKQKTKKSESDWK